MRVTGAVGEWIAFQLGVWHEIATWYGWASVRGFSEKASAFSPEGRDHRNGNSCGARRRVTTIARATRGRPFLTKSPKV